MEDDKHQELSFFKELDELVFEQPNGTRIHFSDNQSIFDLFHRQCPNWTEKGITSVQQKVKKNLNGEDAEKKLYRFFIEEFSNELPGMIVIPNFSTKGRFATKGTNVEIDMIVIHPRGVILFNVTNQHEKDSSVNAMRETIGRQTRLLQMLQKYRTDSTTATTIHSVICDFANEESKIQDIKELTFEVSEKWKNNGKIFILAKNDLQQNCFLQNWRRIVELSGVDITRIGSYQEVLAARLVALQLFEMKSSLRTSSIQTGLKQVLLQSQGGTRMSAHYKIIVVDNDIDQESSFYQELKHLDFKRPNGSKIQFPDTQSLLNLFHQQCPNWKDGGITSVPMARKPHFLLCGQQMTKELQKKMNANIKGDEAEKKLYRLFIEEYSFSKPGVIIIPNFTTVGRFATEGTNVEIDMIVIHPTSGVFLFNVKNEGQKGTSVNAMREELARHTRLVQLLQTYNADGSNVATPINSVICDFARDVSKFRHLEGVKFKGKENSTIGEVLSFGKSALYRNEIPANLQCSSLCSNNPHDSNLYYRPLLDEIEVLAARLVALKLFEKKSSLINSSIHAELKEGSLQSQKNPNLLAAQLGGFGQIPGFESCLSMNSEIEFPPGKRKFIIWTRGQIKAAAALYEHLTAGSSKPLRLLVTGGKGSGKTFLLILIAKIAQTILKEGESSHDQQKMHHERCLVCDGTFYSYGLTKMLTEALSSVGVTVFNHVYDGNLDEVVDDFLKALKQCRVLLCDDFTMDVTYPLLRGRVSDGQHCVFFTSTEIENLESVLPEFEQIHLFSCLRSTCQLSKAANDWLKRGLKGTYLTIPLNNFEGEQLEIRQCSDDFEMTCFEVIKSYADKLEDIDVLPVAAFVNDLTIDKLFRKLSNAFYPCSFNENPHLNHQTNKQNPVRKTPIMFLEPRRFDGCEWSTVIILLDLRCVYAKENILKDIYLAITRASMKVAIVYRNIPCNENEILKLWSKTIKTTFEDIYSEYNQRQNDNGKPVVLFVGETPEHLNDYIDIRSNKPTVPGVKGVSLYKSKDLLFESLRNPSFICHTDDVFLQSDLQKLSQYDIQFIVVSHTSAFESDEHFNFYKATIDCITAGMNVKFHVYDNVSSFQKAAERSRNLKEFLLEHSNKKNAGRSVKQSRDERLQPNDFVFSWEQWMAKGDELQRLGKTDSAKICYQYSIANLEKVKNSLERLETTSLKTWLSITIKYKFRMATLRRRLAAIEDQSTIAEPERPGTSQ